MIDLKDLRTRYDEIKENRGTDSPQICQCLCFVKTDILVLNFNKKAAVYRL